MPKFSFKSVPLISLLKGLIYIFYLSVAIIFVNIIQCLSIVFYPLSYKAFYKINTYCAGFWWGSVAFFMRNGQQIQFEFIGDELLKDENSIVISNHQQTSDIPVILTAAAQANRISELKWFVKDSFKFIPGCGWGLLFLGSIFVKRNWLKDKKSIEKAFHNLKSKKLPFWLISFLEGTRITEEKVLKSQAFSKKNNKPIYHQVLAPKTKGFIASVQALRKSLDSVYDLTIYFPQGIPTLAHIFFGKVKKICIYIKRTSIEDLPSTASDLDSWIWKSFSEKEALLNSAQQKQIQNKELRI